VRWPGRDQDDTRGDRRGERIDYHVAVEGHLYSVPYRLVHKEVEARVGAEVVEILHRRVRVASQRRSYAKGGLHDADRAHPEREPRITQVASARSAPVCYRSDPCRCGADRRLRSPHGAARPRASGPGLPPGRARSRELRFEDLARRAGDVRVRAVQCCAKRDAGSTSAAAQGWGGMGGRPPIAPPMAPIPPGKPCCCGASPIFRSSTSKTSIPCGRCG
jgi:hypothetical protein